MQRIFTVTCSCGMTFPVDYSIRFLDDVQLECPYCHNKFLIRDAAKLDERWAS